MTVPNNRDRIIAHLQGKWLRKLPGNKTISFTINGSQIQDIETEEYNIKEEAMILNFNESNLKWQLTASVFGTNSVLINFEKKSFTLLLKDGMTIVPPVNITEVFHQNVWFYKA